MFKDVNISTYVCRTFATSKKMSYWGIGFTHGYWCDLVNAILKRSFSLVREDTVGVHVRVHTLGYNIHA